MTQPQRKAPQGATDCHFHIFGPMERYPLATGSTYLPPDASVPAYLSMAERLGVERMVIVQPSIYGTDNRCTLDAIDQFGASRTRAVAVVDSRFTPTMLRDMDRRGVRGVRFNCINSDAVQLDQLETIARRIEPLGWHIQLWCHGHQLLELADTLRSLPVPIVIDHLGSVPSGHGIGHPEFQTVLRLVGSGKCWVKLCVYRFSDLGPPYTDTLAFTEALIKTAPQRCLWGTDWPHIYLQDRPTPDDGHLLDLLYGCAPREEMQRMILVENPARLYGFPDETPV